MHTGAVITAAGMSSRMGAFKPLLKLGSVTMAEHLVSVFRRSGVEEVVMVTGYRAKELEHHLAGSGVVFVRNEDYMQTAMFASAQLGLSVLASGCDRIFFTPVDAPLFSPATVAALLSSGAELACPVFDGQRGHPLLLSGRVATRLLQDDGEGGMRSAVLRCGVKLTEVAVPDEGILYDADTMQDYRALLSFYSDSLRCNDVQKK